VPRVARTTTTATVTRRSGASPRNSLIILLDNDTDVEEEVEQWPEYDERAEYRHQQQEPEFAADEENEIAGEGLNANADYENLVTLPIVDREKKKLASSMRKLMMQNVLAETSKFITCPLCLESIVTELPLYNAGCNCKTFYHPKCIRAQVQSGDPHCSTCRKHFGKPRRATPVREEDGY
jgi:hypothetical protein